MPHPNNVNIHLCQNEERLRALEQKGAIHDTKIDNLIERLEELTTWIKALVMIILTSSVGAFGYLIVQWVAAKKG